MHPDTSFALSRLTALHTLASGIKADASVHDLYDVVGASRQYPKAAKGGPLTRIFNALRSREPSREFIARLRLNTALKELRGFARKDAKVAEAVAGIKAEMRSHVPGQTAGAIKRHLQTIHTAMTPPSLPDVPGLAGPKGAIQQALDGAKNAGVLDLDVMRTTLTKALADGLVQAGSDMTMKFSVSDGRNFKAQLAAIFKAEGVDVSTPDFVAMVDGIYNDGVVGSSPIDCKMGEEYDADGKSTGRDRVEKVNAFTVGGRQYKLKQDFNTAGPAAVGLYTRVDTNNKEHVLVLKYLKPYSTGNTPLKQFEEFANEAKAHKIANDRAPGSFGKLEHAILMPDGRLALAMEFAPHGDLYKAIQKLHADSNNGTVPARFAEDIRQTMARDTLEALYALQQLAGLNHTDLKGANLFINAQGKAQIADWGTAQEGDARHLEHNFENMIWNDPLATQAFEALGKTPGKATGADISGFAADKWSIGTVLWEIYAGKPLFDHPGAGPGAMEAVSAKQAAFLAMKLEERRDFLFNIQKRPGMAPVPADLQDIILSLLDGDASRRMNADEALGKPMFHSNPNLGSQNVRDHLCGRTPATQPGRV